MTNGDLIKNFTPGDLLEFLTKKARKYRGNYVDQLVADSHMNKLTELYGLNRDKIWFREEKELSKLKDAVAENIHQEELDAILVDFINFVGMEIYVDYALHTKDLEK